MIKIFMTSFSLSPATYDAFGASLRHKVWLRQTSWANIFIVLKGRAQDHDRNVTVVSRRRIVFMDDHFSD